MKKKLLFIAMLAALVVGCGKEYKIYTSEEKTNIINSAKEGDKNAEKKLETIMKELETAAEKGDKKAIAELRHWKYKIKSLTEKANLLNGEW